MSAHGRKAAGVVRQTAVSLLATAILPLHAAAAPLRQTAIGVPAWENSLNYMFSDAAAAVVTRSLVLESAISKGASTAHGDARVTLRGDHITLGLIDQLSQGRTAGEWRLRIRGNAIFHSTQRIEAEDVIDSLEHCPEAQDVIEHAAHPDPKEASPDVESTGHEYVNVYLRSTTTPAEALYAALARCPIWSREARRTFGDLWGVGTNIVGSGPFQVVAFSPGRFIELSSAGRGESREAVEIRGFESDSQGLTALRAGNVAALLLRDGTEAAHYLTDSTLTVLECPLGKVVVRKSEALSCNPFFDARFRTPALSTL